MQIRQHSVFILMWNFETLSLPLVEKATYFCLIQSRRRFWYFRHLRSIFEVRKARSWPSLQWGAERKVVFSYALCRAMTPTQSLRVKSSILHPRSKVWLLEAMRTLPYLCVWLWGGCFSSDSQRDAPSLHEPSSSCKTSAFSLGGVLLLPCCSWPLEWAGFDFGCLVMLVAITPKS